MPRTISIDIDEQSDLGRAAEYLSSRVAPINSSIKTVADPIVLLCRFESR